MRGGQINSYLEKFSVSVRKYRNGKHKTVKAHSGPVLKISLSHQEDFLMSCSSDKTIKMWDLDGKFKQSFVGHTNWVR